MLKVFATSLTQCVAVGLVVSGSLFYRSANSPIKPNHNKRPEAQNQN